MAATRGSRRWQVTLSLVLVVALGLVVVVGVLRLAQLRSVPLGAARAAPAQGAGPTTVELSADAAGHSSADAVRELLTKHFTAINSKNYVAWANTVVSSRVSAQTEPAWRQAYGSTIDGNVRIIRIDEQPAGRLVALVSFVSTQTPESAPEGLKLGQICWRVAMPLVAEPWRIDVTRNGNVLRGPCS